MITVTNGDLRDDFFQRGMRKLANHSFKSPKASYNIAKLFKSFGEKLELTQKPFLDIAKRYAELDEQGEFKRTEGMPDGSFKIRNEKEARDGWEKDVKEFFAITAELTGDKVLLTDAVEAGLTPAELAKLDPLLNVIMPVEATGEKK